MTKARKKLPAEQKITAVQRDAARYRWLKHPCRCETGDMDRIGAVEHVFVCVEDGVSESMCGSELDAAIDAEMKRPSARHRRRTR